MKHLIAPLFPLLLLTAACARVEPVTDDDLETIEEAPAPALPAAEEEPAVALTEGMTWASERDAVLLNAADGAPALQFACADDGQGIVLTRYGVEGDGTAGTLTVVGNGVNSRVPVVADGEPQGGRFDWTATLTRGELASSIRTSFLEDQPVNITATGVAPITVMPGEEIRALLDRCVGAATQREQEAADERSDVETLRDGVAAQSE